MSEASENTALAELLDSINDRRIRRKVKKLLQFGEEAVRSLGELDSALYVREGGEEQLQIVSDAVLSHVRRLLEYLGMVAATVEPVEDTGSDDVDFDFGGGGGGGGGAKPAASGKPAGIAAVRDKSDEEKWDTLAREMDSLQYGLGSEIKEFDRRFSEALEHARKEQALRDLNDATTSLMDGVFAVMTSVYECFLGYAEPERMIPGHRDTLGKALAVRRAIADLRREVQLENQSIQDRTSSPLVLRTSYSLLVQSLTRFMESDTFFYLRSDDRKDFQHFREQFEHGDAKTNRLTCEGFDKYLDSLSFVSQRGVVIKHDTDLKAKIASELKRALAYAKILPELVCEVINEAFVLGDRLYGLDDRLDKLITKWSEMDELDRNDVQEAISCGQQLFDFVKPPPAPTTSSDPDFF